MLVVIALFILVAPSMQVAATKETRDWNVQEGSCSFHGLGHPYTLDQFRDYDVVEVFVNVSYGGPIDVYLMKAREYNKMKDGEDFTAEVSKQNTNRTRFRWQKHSDILYVIGFDNMDNAKDNDAQPYTTAYIHFSIEIDERHQDMELWAIQQWGILAGAIIIVATVVFVKVKLR